MTQGCIQGRQSVQLKQSIRLRIACSTSAFRCSWWPWCSGSTAVCESARAGSSPAGHTPISAYSSLERFPARSRKPVTRIGPTRTRVVATGHCCSRLSGPSAGWADPMAGEPCGRPRSTDEQTSADSVPSLFHPRPSGRCKPGLTATSGDRHLTPVRGARSVSGRLAACHAANEGSIPPRVAMECQLETSLDESDIPFKPDARAPGRRCTACRVTKTPACSFHKPSVQVRPTLLQRRAWC